ACGGTHTIWERVWSSGVCSYDRTATWTAGQIAFNGGTFNNNNAFTAQPDNSMVDGGGTNAFNNNAAGTFTRNTGTLTLTCSIPFNNAGTISASNVWPRVTWRGTITCCVSTDSGAVVGFGGGTHAIT